MFVSLLYCALVQLVPIIRIQIHAHAYRHTRIRMYIHMHIKMILASHTHAHTHARTHTQMTQGAKDPIRVYPDDFKYVQDVIDVRGGVCV